MKTNLRIFAWVLSLMICLHAFIPLKAIAKALPEEELPTISDKDYLSSKGWAGFMVIPIEFWDSTFEENPEAMLEQIFVGSGLVVSPSVMTYYQRSSYGAFYTDVVVQRPVTLEGNKSDYEDDPSGIIDEALTQIANRGVDIPTFDENGNGIIDAIFLVFPGAPEEDSFFSTHTGTLQESLYTNGVYVSNYSFLSYESMLDGSVRGEYEAIRQTALQLGLKTYPYLPVTVPAGEDNSAAAEGDPVVSETLFTQDLGDLDPYAKSILGWNQLRDIEKAGSYELTSSSVTSDGLKIHVDGAEGYYLLEYVIQDANQKPLSLPEGGAVRVFRVENGFVSQIGGYLAAGETMQLDPLYLGSSLVSVTLTDTKEASCTVSLAYEALDVPYLSEGSKEDSKTPSETSDPAQESIPTQESQPTEDGQENKDESKRPPVVSENSADPEDGRVIPDQESINYNGKVSARKITVPIGISMVIFFGACYFFLRDGDKPRRR